MEKVLPASTIWLFILLALSIVRAASRVYFYLRKKRQNLLDISTRMRGPEATVDTQEKDAHRDVV